MKQQTRDAVILLFIGAAICIAIGGSGCGQGPKGDPGSVGAAGATGATGPAGAGYTPPAETPLQTLVDAENTYREGLGQTALTAGLSCSVQLVGAGQWLSSSSPGYSAAQGVVTALAGSTNYTYLYLTSFNQPDSASGPNNEIPVPLQPLFQGQNYKISCSGQYVVADTAYYDFDVNSDDGSILTVDGAQVVNNDGNHAITDKQGTKYLRQGVHTFSLLYAQSGGGNFGLVVKVNGALITGDAWYH
jgi:hypothetical protein